MAMIRGEDGMDPNRKRPVAALLQKLEGESTSQSEASLNDGVSPASQPTSAPWAKGCVTVSSVVVAGASSAQVRMANDGAFQSPLSASVPRIPAKPAPLRARPVRIDILAGLTGVPGDSEALDRIISDQKADPYASPPSRLQPLPRSLLRRSTVRKLPMSLSGSSEGSPIGIDTAAVADVEVGGKGEDEDAMGVGGRGGTEVSSGSGEEMEIAHEGSLGVAAAPGDVSMREGSESDEAADREEVGLLRDDRAHGVFEVGADSKKESNADEPGSPAGPAHSSLPHSSPTPIRRQPARELPASAESSSVQRRRRPSSHPALWSSSDVGECPTAPVSDGRKADDEEGERPDSPRRPCLDEPIVKVYTMRCSGDGA